MVGLGGSLKGFLPALLGSMGEWTDVASANRAVRGEARVMAEEELEEVLGLTVTVVVLVLFPSALLPGKRD